MVPILITCLLLTSVNISSENGPPLTAPRRSLSQASSYSIQMSQQESAEISRVDQNGVPGVSLLSAPRGGHAGTASGNHKDFLLAIETICHVGISI